MFTLNIHFNPKNMPIHSPKSSFKELNFNEIQTITIMKHKNSYPVTVQLINGRFIYTIAKMKDATWFTKFTRWFIELNCNAFQKTEKENSVNQNDILESIRYEIRSLRESIKYMQWHSCEQISEARSSTTSLDSEVSKELNANLEIVENE